MQTQSAASSAATMPLLAINRKDTGANRLAGTGPHYRPQNASSMALSWPLPVSNGPILTFAPLLSRHLCECWNQRTTGKYKILVEFRLWHSLSHSRLGRSECQIHSIGAYSAARLRVTAWQWRISQKVTLKQQAKAQFDDRALVIRAPYGSPAFVKKNRCRHWPSAGRTTPHL